MRMLKYPIFNIGRYPKIWRTDEGAVLGLTKAGSVGLIDDTAADYPDLGNRRLNSKSGYPLADLGNPIHNYAELIVAFNGTTHLIDNLGNIVVFKRRNSYWVLSFKISSALTVPEGYLIMFKNTITKVLLDKLPPDEAQYGMFLQHDKLGEIFLGFAEEKTDTRIRV